MYFIYSQTVIAYVEDPSENVTLLPQVSAPDIAYELTESVFINWTPTMLGDYRIEFIVNCTNVYVLQAVYHHYRTHYGEMNVSREK